LITGACFPTPTTVFFLNCLLFIPPTKKSIV
jgi:hypothetical protein